MSMEELEAELELARQRAEKALAEVTPTKLRPTATATMKNSHGGYAGQTLIQRIQGVLDKQLKSITDDRSRGRAEGMAATLGILRDTSMSKELNLSQERNAT